MKFLISALLLCSVCFARGTLRNTTQAPCNILDSFYPKVKDGNRLWISADVLLWIPSEDSIVLTNRKTALFDVNDVTLQPTLDTKFNWDLGSRIGFGYLFGGPKENWDMALYWTFFPTSTTKKSSTHMDISKGMFPIWSLSNDIIPYDWVANAKMDWTLNLNLIDLDFGRSYSFRWFHIRPFTGLRSVWVDQDFNVKYGGGIFANGPDLYALSNEAGFDQIKMRNDYWGIGPLLGVRPEFDLGKGLRIYAGGICSYTLGLFNLNQQEVYLMKTRFERRTQPFAGRWIMDVTGGLSWATFLASHRYALTFNLGWEYHVFFNQFALKKDRFGLIPDNNDLTLMGGVFSVRFNF